MNISNSKKQLAKIIRENGGWREVAEFSAQDGDGTGSIDFFKSEPRYCAEGKCWRGRYDAGDRIEKSDVTIKNYHQTILSRDEYLRLYPAPDADGWIEWKGDEGDGSPVDGSVIVDVEYYDKIKHLGHIACNVNWSLAISYRLHKPEHVEQEYPDGVKPIDPAKQEPTIEQLAAEYRAKLAIARQAQEEADSHRCGAEAALDRLYQAGLAIGLDIAIADSEQEGEKLSELVITDWRDLQVGDEIVYLGGTTNSWIGKKGAVQLIDDGESNLKILFRCGEEGESGNPRDWPSTRWLSDFKFIRRP